MAAARPLMSFGQLCTRDHALERSLHGPGCCSSAGEQPGKALTMDRLLTCALPRPAGAAPLA
eukprot:10579563-Alexandrium_andersonii.AAC.1